MTVNTRSDNTEAKAALRREIEASQTVHAELDDSHAPGAPARTSDTVKNSVDYIR